VDPRISVSAISTFGLDLADDLDFWDRHAIDHVGVSVAKLDAFGWDEGVTRVAAAVDEGLRVGNLIGLGPFRLDDPRQWPEQRDRLRRALDAASALRAQCLVFTTGPAGALTWEQAADALGTALARIVDEARTRGVEFAIEHTNSLRVDVGFVHTLRDVVDLARDLGTGVCMEVNACWAERGLAATIRDHVDVLRLVQISDFAVGTLSTPNRLVPGDGNIPIARIIGQLLAAGYDGAFDLELIGPAIESEGYDLAVPRSVAALTTILETVGSKH
jgi:sugar phosphate isomerase/epimerase